MYKKILTWLLFSIALDAAAQERWTLKQCIDYGLKNNRNNVIYANQKRIADAKAKEAIADYLPRVSMTSTLDNNLKLQQSVIPAGVIGPHELKVSLTQKYASNTMTQLDQVLYDQSMLTGLKANKYNRQQSELNEQQSQEAIIYNVSTAYINIFVYHQQLAQLQANKETYQKQMDIFRAQVNKGVVLQKDLDKVSVDYNNTTSKIRVALSNITLAENELKYEMGFPINDSLAVDLSAPPGAAASSDSVVSFSPDLRVEYQLSKVNIKLLEVEKSAIKAEALPRLSAYARYGVVGFGKSLKGAYGELLPYSAVGLKLNIPILDFFKRNARYKQAVLNHSNAEEQLKIVEGKYYVEYQNAYTKYLQAQINIENDKRNVALAQSVFQVTDVQFRKGVTDLNDWLNTQNQLREAQNGYLTSIYNYYLTRIDLEKSAGTLKRFYQSL
ncbi:MAG: TolC family protein [Chitinophaga sp.]|uniref:TolC family protein n=1 Tax=Chitinophaga sp. TaxID=1869181 RepID=UPI001B1DA9EF|nr:TolC family protein [Chitinophaga sp.]MBO9728500.1 TolC family protein [Chitinophaga sp.]